MNSNQPTGPSPSNSSTSIPAEHSSTVVQLDFANSIHPLHGMSVAERTESRQRVFAKALAEILRRRPQGTMSASGAESRS
jgi:hypothetical protein